MSDIKVSYALLEKILILKRSALFSGISTSDLRTVAAVADELHMRHGERIVGEDEIGDAMFLIVHGSVRIVKAAETEHPVELAVMSAGECFGEMSAIDEEVRSATAFANKECVMLRISKDALHEAMRDCPQIGIELLKIFVKRLRCADRQIEELSKAPARKKA